MGSAFVRLLWLPASVALSLCLAAADTGSRETTYRYSALGDSITWGAGASDPSSSWVARYAEAVGEAEHDAVAVANLGVPGATSTDLLHSVTADPLTREAIAQSDLITIAIGTNDFYFARALHRQFTWGTCGGIDNQLCLSEAVDAYRANLRAIVAEVRALTDGRDVTVQLVGVYSGEAARDRTDGFSVFIDHLAAMNHAAAGIAREYGIDFVDVRRAFNGAGGTGDPATVGYTTAADRVHPSDAGHEAIAELMSARFVPSGGEALVTR